MSEGKVIRAPPKCTCNSLAHVKNLTHFKRRSLRPIEMLKLSAVMEMARSSLRTRERRSAAQLVCFNSVVINILYRRRLMYCQRLVDENQLEALIHDAAADLTNVIIRQ